MFEQENKFPANPLDGQLMSLGNPTGQDEEMDRILNSYTSTGMNEEDAKWATAMELNNKEQGIDSPELGMASGPQPAQIPMGNAPPPQPHRAWGDAQLGVTGAGLAAAPFTMGASMPIAGAVNAGIGVAKKLFG